MIITLSLKVPPMPKPRGMIGKAGNIYHSSKQYTQWNKDFTSAYHDAVDGKISIPKVFHTLCFLLYGKPKRGHKPDGDNLQGGVQDALVKTEVLSDDNVAIINSWYGKYISSLEEKIEIIFCEDKKDFLFFINKYID